LSQFEPSTRFSLIRIRTHTRLTTWRQTSDTSRSRRKDASVYVDGFADKVEKAKKFALRPGNHNIELRDSDGRTLYKEQVAVIVGKTTELHAG